MERSFRSQRGYLQITLEILQENQYHWPKIFTVNDTIFFLSNIQIIIHCRIAADAQ